MAKVPAKFEAATSNCLGAYMHIKENTSIDLDLWVNVIQNVAQYHLHHNTYAPAKFGAATTNSLGGDSFTKKKNII